MPELAAKIAKARDKKARQKANRRARSQAEEEQRHGGRAARKTRKATILNSPDDAWRKEDIGGALSVDEIQRREHWEAEEQEALALIAAVYGKSAIESSSL